MIAFSIADNGDGTGATATFTGTSGAVNTVYYSLIGSTWSWFNAGSLTGDGTIDFSTSLGVYLAYLYTAPSAVSPLAGFTVSNLYAQSIQTRLRNAIAATLATLPFPPAANIYQLMWPDGANVKFPAILLTMDGVQETEEPILSTLDDVGYPVRVMFADRTSKNDHSKLPLYELWRLYGMNCFRNLRVLGVPESKICRIEELVIIDPNLPQYQHVVSGFTVRCICRQPRGIGVLTYGAGSPPPPPPPPAASGIFFPPGW